MDRDRYQRAKSIFLDAIDLPGPERHAYVTSACGTDAELRQEVESLLAFEAPDDYLASPVDSKWLESDTFAQLLSESGAPAEDASPEHDALLGQTVSNYRVLERIGHGGMGVVYLAEDLRLERRAALKFLKPSLMLSDAKARFLREALVTAKLDPSERLHALRGRGDIGRPGVPGHGVLRGRESQAASRRGTASPCRRHSTSRGRSRVACRPPTSWASCIATSSPATSC